MKDRFEPVELGTVTQQVSDILDRIRTPLMEDLKFKPFAVAFSRKRFEDADLAQQTEAMQWLKSFEVTMTEALKDAIQRVPKETWAIYAAMGPDAKGIWEVDNLNKVITTYRDVWKIRPYILRRDKLNPAVDKPPTKKLKKKGKKNAN